MKRIRILAVVALAATASVPVARAADKVAPDEKKNAAPAKAADKADNTVASVDADRWLAFFDKFVAYIDADQNDCDKMAKDLGAHLDANQALMAKAKAASAAGKKLPAAAQQHMMDTLGKLGPGIQKCGSNEKVAAVMSKIPR
jgi:hypothetical protein